MAVILYFTIGLTLVIFFIDLSYYVRAMVMDLKQQIDNLHNHKSNLAKFNCLKDGFKFHSEILKLVGFGFGKLPSRSQIVIFLCFFLSTKSVLVPFSSTYHFSPPPPSHHFPFASFPAPHLLLIYLPSPASPITD